MGRPDEALGWLRLGSDPPEIARKMGVSLTTVLGYLDRKIGDGQLRRSDIYFSLPPAVRRNPPSGTYQLILERYHNGAAAYGDMYDDVRGLEIGIHTMVRRTLEEVFGRAEEEWWKKGVPTAVRTKCAERRELDDDGYFEHYCYTDFVDLSKILDSSWKHFQSGLPKELSANKPQFLADLRRLAGIRNRVMHPIRGAPPTEDDFDFVRAFKQRISGWPT